MDGYTFAGWAPTSNPAVAEYQPGESITVTSTETELIAVWEAEGVSFTPGFHVGPDATGGPSDVTGYGTGPTHRFTIPDDVPVRDGYTFLGWSVVYGGGADYRPGQVFVSGSAEATLYAVWHDDTVIEITSDPQDRVEVGGTYTYEVSTNITDYTVAISGTASNWLSVDGHTISGRFTAPGTYTLTVRVTDGEEWSPATMTFDIRVMETDLMEYRVEFVSSGGTRIDDQWVRYGGSVEVPETPVKAGFEFGGWYTDSGRPYDFDDPVLSDMTLRAVWIMYGDSGDDPIIDIDGMIADGGWVWMLCAGLALVCLFIGIASSRNWVFLPMVLFAALAVLAWMHIGGRI